MITSIVHLDCKTFQSTKGICERQPLGWPLIVDIKDLVASESENTQVLLCEKIETPLLFALLLAYS